MTARISAILLCLSFSALAEDPLLQQPPLKLTVTVGEKEIAVTPGEEKKVEGEFKDPVIKVSTGAVRTFSLAGISFDYPASWNWQAEKVESGYTWTMEGPDVTLIVSKYTIPVDGKNIAEGFAEPKDRKAKVEAWSETHGGREFKGWRVAAEMSGEPVQFYVLPIPVKDGSALLQIIDNDDEGKSTAEFRSTLEMLGKTLQSGAK